MEALYKDSDSFGEINVFDDGKYRILSFAEGDEQSRMQIAAPHVLQHDYTQAMLLSLLFTPQPKRVCILGLGGGSLLNALYHAIPKVNIAAIELREKVIDAANRFFKLPIGKRIEIINTDALLFLTDHKYRKFDILFTDIYQSNGIDEKALTQHFIEASAGAIKEQGTLVINCWDDQINNQTLVETLNEKFQQIIGVDTGSGNWVIVATNSRIEPNNKQTKLEATKLSNKLEIPLTKWTSKIKYIK
ncbi:spermidine synthase [Marinomonas mediterranea]|uniref:fused MFS/spermidine synthase n=1 Tax=Marinomonas mediterranea TaxID=119864 RepID=UPI00234B0287|nr:fused MFS/spermidine synthase [Marinomonas mediterranea]WCN13347.1 spermidine synthase [Marinomonas mediterranea]